MHSVREQLHLMCTSDERCTLANHAHHMLQTGGRFWLAIPPVIRQQAMVPVSICSTKSDINTERKIHFIFTSSKLVNIMLASLGRSLSSVSLF
jgi:hypothetical protein